MGLSVRTVVIGCSFGGGDSVTAVELPEAGLTVRALIERKIEKDVQSFNRNRHLLYGREYRAPEEMIEDEESAADPARHGTYPTVAWEPEAERAIEAWREGAFRILIDDEKVDDLEQVIAAEPGQDIVFMRLMPFVSG